MKRLFLGLTALALAACGQHEAGLEADSRFTDKAPHEEKQYVFGVQPLHNPVRLFELYGPLVDYLNRKIPDAAFQLRASRSYQTFEARLYARQFDFALSNPYETLVSLKHGYHVIAKMGDDDKFCGILLVRRDSGIRSIQDLKGKSISYPAITAPGAAMLPQYFLQTHGLDVNHDVSNVYVGSHESSIMNVYLGNVAAGATSPLPWQAFQKEHPREAGALEVRWQTPSLINSAVVARDDVPPALAAKVARLLAEMHLGPEGVAILGRLPLSRFQLARDGSYRPMGDFLREFSRTVRPLEGYGGPSDAGEASHAAP